MKQRYLHMVVWPVAAVAYCASVFGLIFLAMSHPVVVASGLGVVAVGLFAAAGYHFGCQHER